MNIRNVVDRFKYLLPAQGNSGKDNLQRKSSDPIRIGTLVLIVGCVGFLVWAAFAPLDEGVPSQGVVSIATRSKVVQHLRGGTVESVHVKEGQFVDKGDVLISLESSEVNARYEDVRQRYLGLRAAESRLIAEQNGAREISFHEDLLHDPDQVLVDLQVQNQTKLFVSRQRFLSILKEQLASIRGLVKDGYAPLDQQRELEKKIAEMQVDTASEMARVRLEVEADAEKLKALSEELSNTEIRSPVAGQVVGLEVQTVGAVITPGEKIMEIVPLDENLIVEVKIMPHLIDKVHAGLLADVRFSSFSHSPQLVVEGRIESVSNDLLTEPRMNPAQPGSSYYLARILITPDGLKKLGDRQLQPGMPVESIIKTGERSFLTYLLHPLIKRVSASMKEE